MPKPITKSFRALKKGEQYELHTWWSDEVNRISFDTEHGLQQKTFDRVANGVVPFQRDHSRASEDQLGKITKFYVKDGDLALDVEFSTATEKQSAIQEILDGTRPGVSIGLMDEGLSYEVTGKDDNGRDLLVTSYNIAETSSVTTPAFDSAMSYSQRAAGTPAGVLQVYVGKDTLMSDDTPQTTKEPQVNVEERAATVSEMERLVAQNFESLDIGGQMQEHIASQFAELGIQSKAKDALTGALEQVLAGEQFREKVRSQSITPVSDSVKQQRKDRGGDKLTLMGMAFAQAEPNSGDVVKMFGPELAYVRDHRGQENENQADKMLRNVTLPGAALESPNAIWFSREDLDPTIFMQSNGAMERLRDDKLRSRGVMNAPRPKSYQDIMMNFAAITVDAGAIPESHQTAWIDYLHARTPILQYCDLYTGLSADFVSPASVASVGTAWVAANGNVSTGSPDVDPVSLTPHTVGSIIEAPALSAIQLGGGINGRMVQNFQRQMVSELGGALEGAVIAGTGGSNQPAGVLGKVPSVHKPTDIASTAKWTWPHFTALREFIVTDNAPAGGRLLVCGPTVYKAMLDEPTFRIDETGANMNRAALGGPNIMTTFRTSLPGEPVIESNHTGAKVAIYGDFMEVMVGIWDSMLMVTHRKPANGALEVSMFQFADLNVKHANSFARQDQA